MPRDMTIDGVMFESAIEVARELGIPADVAEKLWARFNEIRDDVNCGLMTDDEGGRSFTEFCARLGAIDVGVAATVVAGGATKPS